MGRLMYWSTGVLVVVVLNVVLVTQSHAAAQEFVPQWRRGDRWLVRTETRSLAMTEHGPSERDDADLWIYSVVGVRDYQGSRFFHIIARSWRTPPTHEAAFLFVGVPDGKGGVSSLALVRAAYRGLGIPEVERSFDSFSSAPYPVINDDTPIPSSFPLFHDGRFVGTGSGVRFSVSQRLHSMVFARDVRQVARPIERNDLRGVRLRLRGVSAEDGSVVTITRPHDNYMEQQLWHAKYPWFLYAETPRTRAWLARVRRAPVR